MRRIKGISLLLIFCFLLVNILQVQSEVVKAKENNPKDDRYNFTCAFVWGKYEMMDKWIDYFHIHNSNITNNTINVLGYKNWEHRWYRVMANEVTGGLRIGFVGRHQCCVFAFGFFGLIVYGVNASSSGWM